MLHLDLKVGRHSRKPWSLGVFCEPLFFSKHMSCPLSCLSCRQPPCGKCFRKQTSWREVQEGKSCCAGIYSCHFSVLAKFGFKELGFFPKKHTIFGHKLPYLYGAMKARCGDVRATPVCLIKKIPGCVCVRVHTCMHMHMCMHTHMHMRNWPDIPQNIFYQGWCLGDMLSSSQKCPALLSYYFGGRSWWRGQEYCACVVTTQHSSQPWHRKE